MIQDTGGTCPKTWSAGPLVQKLDSRSLGRCPWQVCRLLRWRLPDWSCYSNTNSLAQTEIKRAAHRRLLDWSWSQQNREKPKGQLGGDCLSGLGPNRNRGKPKGSSTETARPVLFTTEKGRTKGAAHRRLLDWSWSQQKRGKPTAAHRRLLDQFWSLNPKGRQSTLAAHRRLLDWSWSQQKRGKPTAAHRRLLDQFWSLNPKGRQSTLDTAWSRGAEGVVM